MGRPKFPRKKYDSPLHPWKEDRIKSERELIKKYGLKNHREIWKAKTRLKKYRQQSRELLAKATGTETQTKKETDQLLLHLTRLSVLPHGSSLDDVLSLETESMLSRRLQTLVYLKGLANTPTHARQLISHGHITINKTKVTVPGYIVTKDEESRIEYSPKSPLTEMSHPARPKTDTYPTHKPPEKPKEEAKPTGEKPAEPEKPKEEKKEQTPEPPKTEEPDKKEELIEEKQKEPVKTEAEIKPEEKSEPSAEPTPKPAEETKVEITEPEKTTEQPPEEKPPEPTPTAEIPEPIKEEEKPAEPEIKEDTPSPKETKTEEPKQEKKEKTKKEKGDE